MKQDITALARQLSVINAGGGSFNLLSNGGGAGGGGGGGGLDHSKHADGHTSHPPSLRSSFEGRRSLRNSMDGKPTAFEAGTPHPLEYTPLEALSLSLIYTHNTYNRSQP